MNLRIAARFFLLKELKCRQLLQEEATFSQARQIAMDCLQHYSQNLNNDLALDVAHVYAIENKHDSALMFVDAVNEKLSPDNEQRIRLRKQEVLSIMACRGQQADKYATSLNQASQITDSILNNTDRYHIEKIDKTFDERLSKQKFEHSQRLRRGLLGLSAAAILMVLALSWLHMARMRRIREIVSELEKRTHASDRDRTAMLSQINIKSESIQKMVANLIDLMKLCLDAELAGTREISNRIKETITGITDDNFWTDLGNHLDNNYDGIISEIAHHPKLTDKDIHFIELSCCGFDYVEIAIILGYRPNYVYTKRKILASKLGIDMPLQDYLKERMQGTDQN